MNPGRGEDTVELGTILLLGAGELGKELAIAAQRLGIRVVAVDRYGDAPAMQVAHAREVVPMMAEGEVERVIRSHRPRFVLPETEAIRTEGLPELEEEGFRIIPSARAVALAGEREGLRRLAAEELGLPTPAFRFAETEEELLRACDELGYPCVVKPIRGYSGRGHSIVSGAARVPRAWAFASGDGASESTRVIVEEFIEFEYEVTLLVVREWDGTTRFVEPIGHRQEQGSYRESWMPVDLPDGRLEKARRMAATITERLGGAGVYGVEFFMTPDSVVFSELSPGPHDTGLVTLVSQDISQFGLHLRAALGLPIPSLMYSGPAASAVILARGEGRVAGYDGVDRALRVETAQLRLFGKPTAFPNRRMGVALATGSTVEEARARALEAAARVEVRLA